MTSSFLCIVSQDFLGSPVVEVLKSHSKRALFVSLHGCQNLDLSEQCRKQGVACCVLPPQKDNDGSSNLVLEGLVSGFQPDIILAIGPEAERISATVVAPKSNDSLLLCLTLETPKLSETSGLELPESTGKPSYPEFMPIWMGADKTRLCIKPLGASDSQTQSIEELVPVSSADTAISLRYKCQRELPKLVEKVFSLSPSDLENLKNGVNIDDVKNSTNNETSTSLQISPHLFSLEQAEAYIRACTFPLYDPPTVISELESDRGLDEVVYFVDTFDHYLHYLSLLNMDSTEASSASEDTKVFLERRSTSNSRLSSPMDKQQYSADTHWYSNVGGTIVKVGSETMKLRRKKSNGTDKLELIPGQAIGAGAKKKLRMNEPLIGLTAHIYVHQALSSGWIGVEGPYMKKFEAAIARVCGVSSAVAVQSGTAALYGAMKALGVGDKSHHVLVPSYTCAACADAIVHAGGVPIATDCELESYALDYESVKKAVDADDKVVGIVIAPCYGVPSRDHLKIWALCEERGLWLCEDNCETYGAKMELEWDGDDKDLNENMSYIKTLLHNQQTLANVGSQSTMSVVSVRSEKMVGVGEGGAIMSRDGSLVSKARWWCSRAPVRGCGLWRVYEHEEIGQNFRLPEVLGAIGLAAVENLPVMIERKRRINKWYKHYLVGDGAEDKNDKVKLSDFLVLQKPKRKDEPVWWLNSLKIDRAKLPADIQQQIKEKTDANSSFNLAESVGILLMKNYPHIEIRPAFFPLNRMSSFAQHARPCPNTDEVYATLLCVPSSAQLEESDVKEVCQALRTTFKEALGY